MDTIRANRIAEIKEEKEVRAVLKYSTTVLGDVDDIVFMGEESFVSDR